MATWDHLFPEDYAAASPAKNGKAKRAYSPSPKVQRYVREQIAERDKQWAGHVRDLKESVDYVYGGGAAWMRALLDEFRRERFLPTTATSDRRHGQQWPFFRTEMELQMLRSGSRLLAGWDPNGMALLGGLAAFVIGEGMQHEVMPVDGDMDQGDKDLCEATRDVLDEFAERTGWQELQAELFLQSREDGDVGVRLFNLGGKTEIRSVLAEQIRQPPGTDEAVWGFGVKTHPRDVQRHLAYWVVDLDDPVDTGEEVSAEEMILIPAGGLPGRWKRCVRRGMPDIVFGILDAINASSKLTRNMALGAAVRAAFAYVRQHANATAEQIADIAADNYSFREARLFRPDLERNVHDIAPGTIADIGENSQFMPPPHHPETGMMQGVVDVLLRQVAAAWSAPEWLVSSNAGNMGAYTSSLVAESPFVKRVKMVQAFYRVRLLWVLRNVVRNAVLAGRLPSDVLRRVKVELTPQSVEVRNKQEEAGVNAAYLEMGIKSVQQICREQGSDYDKVQTELAEHAKRQQEMQADMGMPPPGMDEGGFGPDDGGDGGEPPDMNPFVDAGDAAGGLVESVLREAREGRITAEAAVEILEAWTAAKSRSGNVKAVGTGEDAGKVAYGARAEALLAGKTRKAKQETRQASAARAKEIIARRGQLTREDVAELAQHIDAMTVKELRAARKEIMQRAGWGLKKEKLVGSLKDLLTATVERRQGGEEPAAKAASGEDQERGPAKVKEPWEMSKAEYESTNQLPQAQWDAIRNRAEYVARHRPDSVMFVTPAIGKEGFVRVNQWDNRGPVGHTDVPEDELDDFLRKNAYQRTDKIVKVKGGIGGSLPSESYAGAGFYPHTTSTKGVMSFVGPAEKIDWMLGRLESGGYATEVENVPDEVPEHAGQKAFKGESKVKDHAIEVESALAAGKPVPPEVLADYPDLAAKYPEQSGFTGTDSLGREWRDGKLVAKAEEEPAADAGAGGEEEQTPSQSPATPMTELAAEMHAVYQDAANVSAFKFKETMEDVGMMGWDDLESLANAIGIDGVDDMNKRQLTAAVEDAFQRQRKAGGSSAAAKPSKPAAHVEAAKKWKSSLPSHESKAVELWTKNGYVAVRDFERTGKPPHVAKTKEAWDAAIAKAPVYEGEVYRGVALPPDVAKRWATEGAIIDQDASSSFSTTRDVAQSFASKNTGGDKQMVIMRVRGNRTGRYIGGVEEEEEVVGLKGAKYRVVGVKQIAGPGGRTGYELEMEEVWDQSDSSPTGASTASPSQVKRDTPTPSQPTKAKAKSGAAKGSKSDSWRSVYAAAQSGSVPRDQIVKNLNASLRGISDEEAIRLATEHSDTPHRNRKEALATLKTAVLARYDANADNRI